ncbi:MAG TPA: pyrroloquinoline-quinone synthase PqqC [Candidatus Obscuribacterales bacterium]
MSAPQESMSREEFIERLQKLGEEKYHNRHPFHVRMHEGKLSRAEMQMWILNRFYYQQNLPIKDAIIVSKLPTREGRRLWLQRILDQDGCEESPGGIDAWIGLGKAAGLTQEMMHDPALVLPGVRFAVDAYVNFCRHSPWLQAVASSLTEMFAPSLIAFRIKILKKHYSWIEYSGLEYFQTRLLQAPRDAEHALDLVLSAAESREQQLLALESVSFKCDVLWAMLDAIEQYSVPANERASLGNKN